MGTGPALPTRRSSPRQVPSDRTVGRALVAYWAWDHPSSRSRILIDSPGRGAIPTLWRWRASLPQTTYSPVGSSTATGSGVASNTRVNSWARRASSISSDTSTTVRRAPASPVVRPPMGSPMGLVDRSTQRVVPSSARNRSRPRSAVRVASELVRSARNSARPSGSTSAVQPSPRAWEAGRPVVASHRAFTRTARPCSSRRAAPVGVASTRSSRTWSDETGESGVDM